MKTGGRHHGATLRGIRFSKSAPAPDTSAAVARARSGTDGAASVPRQVTLSHVFEWGRADISGIATTYGVMPMNPGVAGANQISERQLPLEGEIVTLDVLLSADVGGAGKVYDAQIYLNPSDGAGGFAGWVATGITATITGAGGTERTASDHSGGVSFNAGDLIAVYDKRTGTVPAVSAWASVGVLWTEEG